jgi:hypothetical protein
VNSLRTHIIIIKYTARNRGIGNPGSQLRKTDGADVSYYAIMKDSTHKMESIKTNGVIEGREYVTVEKGDYLELQCCYIIE